MTRRLGRTGCGLVEGPLTVFAQSYREENKTSLRVVEPVASWGRGFHLVARVWYGAIEQLLVALQEEKLISWIRLQMLHDSNSVILTGAG
jgi:hypothetical protein